MLLLCSYIIVSVECIVCMAWLYVPGMCTNVLFCVCVHLSVVVDASSNRGFRSFSKLGGC